MHRGKREKIHNNTPLTLLDLLPWGMPVSPARSTAFETAVAQASSDLLSAAFEGRFEDFHRTFQDYLGTWGAQDPFARHLLNRATQRTNLLAFRSLSTDRKELNHQASLRWDAWLSVMPLDMQLGLLLLEGNPYLPSPDFSKFHWESWAAVASAPVPRQDGPARHVHPE